MATKINHSAIDEVIRRNLEKFRRAGALTVRPGYKMTGGWITDKPAIVATVKQKIEGLSPRGRLPSEVEDIPVDVREATALQRLRQSDPASHSLVIAHGRNELNEPHWPYERDVSTGEKISRPRIRPLNHRGSRSPKPQISYNTKGLPPLRPVTREMTIIAHASPDDGYPVLTKFLAATQERLTIAMYDFTSGDLLKTVADTIAAGKKRFRLVLDHPPRNPSANQTDDVTAEQLMLSDPTNAKVAWALTRRDPMAAEWIYPSAYHIKVVVRDRKAFWLSSGNFNVSNQPNLRAQDPRRGTLARADRDWHLIVFDDELAKLFEAYISADFEIAARNQTAGSSVVHETIRAALSKYATEQRQSSRSTLLRKPTKGTNFLHKIFNKASVTVQPLLTPDPGKHTTMYVDKVLGLIQSAKQRIFMQTQYIHPSSDAKNKDLVVLVKALADAYKIGLDVRLITSQYENTAQWIEKLKEYDLDQVLRIQERVHNKGMVVDSKVVMVSSQNWSGDGTLRNRDAGLIIESADIALYFEAIFLDDWVNRATQKVVDVSHPSVSSNSSSSPIEGRRASRRTRRSHK